LPFRTVSAGPLKILILKPSSLGDVIQALPLLRLLKRHLPQSEIHWWLSSDLHSLLADDPDLADIIPFERRRWKSPARWPEMLASIHRMRRERYDWVIDLQCLARSGAFAWLANGAFTIGLDDRREGAAGFYDVMVPRPAGTRHAVDWYLAVLPALGVPNGSQFTWLPERPGTNAAVRAQWPVDGYRWLVINPGARWLNKRWPVESFTELVQRLARDDSDVRFAILGGKEDAPLGAAISLAAPGRCLDLTARTTLPEMIEWIRLSELMITGDTGPMHAAAALGIPVVSIFGPTDPQATGPYGQVDRAVKISLPCAPCMKGTCNFEKPMECLRSITPAQVYAEVQQRLEIRRA
jgi:heptosyltransferase-1